jgi:hypothetical protein
MLRQRGIRQEGAVPFAVPGGPLVPIITIGLIAWLLMSITQAEWTVLLITLGVATGFYLVAARTGKVEVT